MTIRESGEMYLETVYVLSQRSDSVRSIDVGEYMGYSKPSVSRAVSVLKKEGYITVDGRGYITLTETGEEIAKRVYERHMLLSRLFMNIGVDVETAAADACRVEHYISEKTFEALKRHFEQYGSDKKPSGE